MSKPETPCPIDVCDGVNHWRGDQPYACPNAPKAEAPPVPKRVNHKWRYESTDGVKNSVVSTCTVCGLRLDGWPGPHRNPGCKPAPPAPKCDHARIDPSQPCDVCPPAPVSEPPIDWKRVLKFANEYEDDWTPGDLPNASRAILSLIAENAALKAQNAEMADERREYAIAAGEAYTKLLFERDDITAQNATLTAEVERLRDLIVNKAAGDSMRDEDGLFRVGQRGIAKFEADSEAFEDEADSILKARAAREAGKS